ncbi:MAG: MraY family glycosyltransferase [Candidatus Omnitrophota bacterium]
MLGDYLKIFFISGLIAFLATPLYMLFAKKRRIVDKPSARKVHKKPMPTTGGIVIWMAFMVGVFFAFKFNPYFMAPFSERFAGIIFGSFVIILLGLYDDIKGIYPRGKLYGQIFAAIALMNYGFVIETLTNPFGPGQLSLGILSVPFTLIWILGFTNAVNLSDGLDGLAAGVSGIAAIFIFIAACWHNNYVVAFLTLALAGSVFGFLPYNFSPAKIFMGDTGSMFLGFILSAIAIEAYQKSTAVVTLLVPIITLAVPIIDTALAIVRRVARKAKIFSADREHIHHKLLIERASHKKVVLSIYFLTICFGLIALSMQDLRGIYGALALIIVGIATYRWLKAAGFLKFRL